MTGAPPVKKFCLPTFDAHRGVPNPVIKANFKDIGGGRLRCMVCYKKWFDESVVVAVQKGQTEAEAKKALSTKQPPEASVKSYNKSGTPTMRKHLINDHGFNFDQPAVPEPTQRTILSSFAAVLAKSSLEQRKAALVFCMNPGLPFRMASEPYFVQCYQRSVSRNNLPLIISEMAIELKQRMKEEMQGSTVTLALDGWTNFRHRKCFNFLLLWKGTAVFWKTVPSIFGKSADVMTDITKRIIGEVEAELKVTVVACVADNENANKGMFGKLAASRSWLLCGGCNAHGWQLVMVDLFKSVGLIRQAFAALERVLKVFERNQNARNTPSCADEPTSEPGLLWGNTLEQQSGCNVAVVETQWSDQLRPGRGGTETLRSEAGRSSFVGEGRQVSFPALRCH